MPRCFLDTNILVYMADSRDTQKQSDALSFFSNLVKNDEVYISTQVLQELIIAAAKSEGCTTLYSEDLNNGQVIDGVRIENPLV